MDAANRGLAALEARNLDLAISEYSKAISDSPRAVTYYIKRSTAYQRNSEYTKSLADAEAAVVLARERGKRELIGEAQMRRGIALYFMERYGDAKVCFAQTKLLTPKQNALGIWGVKAVDKLDALGQDDERRKVTVKEIPDVDVASVVKAAKASGKSNVAPKADGTKQATANGVSEATKAAMSSSTPTQPTMVQTPPAKIRHEWYQSASSITLSIMVKGVPKDKASIDIQAGSVAISFPLPTGSDYDFTLDPLFARIDPEKSSYKIMGTKIELILQKTEQGKKWHALEGTEPIDNSSDQAQGSLHDASIKNAVLASSDSAPAYPTSSKTGPKNWDKIAQDLSKKPAAKKESTATKDHSADPKPKNATSAGDVTPAAADENDKEDEPAEDEEVTYNSDDDENSDPVNGFFKKLFKNADPDTRRAMMKSYTESNGTALSTNWSEVSKGPVETKPPDGMVERKYES